MLWTIIIYIYFILAVRYEDMFYTHLDKKKRERITDVDQLGQTMIDAGNDFGPGTSYGRQSLSIILYWVYPGVDIKTTTWSWSISFQC